ITADPLAAVTEPPVTMLTLSPALIVIGPAMGELITVVVARAGAAAARPSRSPRTPHPRTPGRRGQERRDPPATRAPGGGTPVRLLHERASDCRARRRRGERRARSPRTTAGQGEPAGERNASRFNMVILSCSREADRFPLVRAR